MAKADDAIKKHPIAVKNGKEYKGKWNGLFQNDNPIHIEIGMGKGQFILNLSSIVYNEAIPTSTVP